MGISSHDDGNGVADSPCHQNDGVAQLDAEGNVAVPQVMNANIRQIGELGAAGQLLVERCARHVEHAIIWGQPVEPGTVGAELFGQPVRNGGGLILISPYKNTFRVSQAYRHLRSDGTYHQGYDLVGIGDKHIYSPVYGTVIRAGWECATLPKKGFGQRVVLRVGCTNYYMYFGHLSQINVAAGQKLKPGDLIGVEGSTGHSTGSHLHWEIRINDIKTGYVSVYHYAGIPNMPGSAAYTSNWAAEIFGPGNLKKPTSGYPQRLYNSALQGALGINQDGVFGANTEKAVKEFQAAHGLTADGIVGTQTKAALSKLF